MRGSGAAGAAVREWCSRYTSQTRFAMASKRRASDGPSGARKRVYTEDQIAQKAIADNFKGWDHEACYVRLRGDAPLTLFERIKQDKKDKTVTMGQLYYDSLRRLYRSEQDPTVALKARDKSEQISPDLFKAFVAANEQRPDRSLLVAYLTSCATAPNNREFVGVAKILLSLKVGCQKQYNVALDILKWTLGIERPCLPDAAFAALSLLECACCCCCPGR
eukprot:4226616-Pyramimonas_sp.AAC.1